MGSAVVKPLKQKRGRIRKSKANLNHASGVNNATGNREPCVNCKVTSLVDSTKKLRQSFLGKSCKVNVDNKQSKNKVCCTYVFSNRKHNPYDSDEEPCQKELDSKKNLVPTQTKNSPHDEIHPENPKDLSPPSQASTRKDILLSSRETQTCTCRNVTPVITVTNTTSSSEAVSSYHLDDGTNNDQDLKVFVQAEGKFAKDNEETEDTIPDKDGGRDAHSSHEFDHLGELNTINQIPSSTNHSAGSLILKDFGHSFDMNIFSTANYKGVQISKTDQHNHEQRLQEDNMICSNETPKHFTCDQQGGSGEPSINQMNYFLESYSVKMGMKANFLDDLDCGNDNDSNTDNRCPSLQDTTPRPESGKSVRESDFNRKSEVGVSLECNENNAIHLTDSFGDVFKQQCLMRSGSNHSSNTSFRSGCKYKKSNKDSEILLLNCPQVEEVLAAGEDFVDEIGERFLLQNNKQSQYPETGRCLMSVVQNNVTDNLTLFSVATDNNTSEKGALGSPCSSVSSSKNSDASCIHCRSPHGSGAVVYVKLNDSLPACSKSNTVKMLSHSLPAAKETQANNVNDGTPHEAASSEAESVTYKVDSKHGPYSVNVAMSQDNRFLSMACSSKESLQISRIAHSPSNSNASKQAVSLPHRENTPLVVPDITTIRVASSKCQPSFSVSEQHQGNSSKQLASRPDSAHANARPSSVSSRHSSVSSRPPTGLGKITHSGLYGQDTRNGCLLLMRDRDSSSSICETPFNTSTEQLLVLYGQDSACSKSSQTSPVSVAVYSTTELTSKFPINDCPSTENYTQRETETPGHANEGTQSFDPCCYPRLFMVAENATNSASVSQVSSKRSDADESKEPTLENLPVLNDTVSGSTLSRAYRVDCLTTESKGSETRAVNEGEPADDTSLPPAFDTGPYCLSPDKIGNIRKQLYEEGLKPAERDGGVAFFIPVTKDGLLPQIDGTVVAERITKTKKASLNYEERMFLANINRQVQLSKKTEFAVRDIRNVKGTTSSSDGSDRTKQNDDLDEFEGSF